MTDIFGKFIKLSAQAQFSASKLSLLISGTTVATVLADHFNLPWLWSMVGVAIFCGCGVAIIYLSGWAKYEYSYNSRLMDIGTSLERIEKELADTRESIRRIEKKLGD